MALVLPAAPAKYDQKNEQSTRGAIQTEDARNAKLGADHVFPYGTGVVLTDSTGVRWRISVDTTGALVATSL